MTESKEEKFLPDLVRSLACGILVAPGVLAIGIGSVFLLNGAFHGAPRPDLMFFGAVVLLGVLLCTGAVFLSGRGDAGKVAE